MARNVRSKVVINQRRVRQLNQAAIVALKQTAEALQDEIRQDEVIPMDKGKLRGAQFHVDDSDAKNGSVRLIHTTPYARRLYYHPEYNFNQEYDRNAKGKWFEDYLPGGKKKNFAKKTYVKKRFEQFFKREAGT